MTHGGGDLILIPTVLLILSGLSQSTELFLISLAGFAGYFWLLH